MQIQFTDELVKNLRKLLRRYRNAHSDLQTLIDDLQAGETPGDQVKNVGFPVYKARVKNSDAKKGRSGGYRVIYYLKTDATCVLVTIYTKSDKADIPADTIRALIQAYLSNKTD